MFDAAILIADQQLVQRPNFRMIAERFDEEATRGLHEPDGTKNSPAG
jgi:hypothetical protein